MDRRLADPVEHLLRDAIPLAKGGACGLDRLDPDSGRVEQFGARLRATGVPNDAALKVIFGGKAQVSMFDMTKLVSKHVK